MRERPFLIGLAGGSGSGKTTMVRTLRDLLPPGHVSTLTQDDHYLPDERQVRDANGWINYDLPEALDLDQLAEDLRCLAQGGTVRHPEYTFNQSDEVRWRVVQPAPVIVVEGLFLMHHQGLRELFDLTVFVEAGEEVQLQRRVARDARERGYGEQHVRYQWEHHVLPAYRNYLLPYRPLCDLVVSSEQSSRHALAELCDRLAREPGLEPLFADVAVPQPA